ncbi:MAG TPA: helix-turn-helix domain-containing protein [Jatrophihabitantaceae bacterium]|nr:helix-turn-helix domain-containing protein [Jatrophihabitantaceae bacterium]
MSTSRPRLAPIFRSDVQLQVLGATYLEPERQFTIAELVERTGKPQPTVAREVERLADAGLVDSELQAGRRAVRAATTSPIFEDLKSLLTKTIGPKAVIEEQLSGIKGIEHAAIYGSWAARFHGAPGPQPNDIDVLVIGTVDVTKVRAAADLATKALGKDVNVSVLTPKEWIEARTGFIRSVKDSPLVDLDLST